MKTARQYVRDMGVFYGYANPFNVAFGEMVRQAQQEAYKQGAEDMRAAAYNSLEYVTVDYDVNLIESRKLSDGAKTRVSFYCAVMDAASEVVADLPIPAMPEGVDA